MKKMLAAKIEAAVARISAPEAPAAASPWVVEEPRDPDHGHLASNAALVLAKVLKRKPTDLADLILANIDNTEGYIEKMEKAGPGFLNFTLSKIWWARALADLLAAGKDFGRGGPKGVRAMVEYVSANPTGPLHVGHGRGAAIGDALTRVMARAGYEVTPEYYINDAGRQMRILGESVLARMRELAGSHDPFPEDHYRGQYILDLAREARDRWPDLLARPEDEAVDLLTDFAQGRILDGIKEDLARFRVGHEVWFSEKTLHQGGQVERALEDMRAKGFIYDRDGAVWFRSEALGDDKDRVLIKSGGEKTYFAADIAYHWNKYQRGFDLVVDIWGSDHHGYVPRMKAAVEAMGRKRDDLGIVLVQFVSLVRDGRPAPMSTRAGEFVTLKEVVDEVGPDAARFMFLTRSADTTLEFDLDLAKARTKDNPVYYVQYVGARIESILKAAGTPAAAPDLARLDQPEEAALIKHLASFPDLIQLAASRWEPHHLTAYLTTLARLFHHYYGQHRVNLPDDPGLTASRLALVKAVRLVVRLGLELLGVESPDQM